MPVGHQRINAKRPDPALELLEALAAQFKPIMKQWGFGVNSLIEHEWNPTFAGRNWNAGEVIEIVLRRRDGTFAPYQFLLHVFCHELAHIREMNHSWAFKSVDKQIRSAMWKLRAQKYFGDGFWSSGRSLSQTGYPGSEGDWGADEPTYTCGGANKKQGRWKKRRAASGASTSAGKARGSAVKLGTTGRQTAISLKAGGRVKRKGAFEGEGNVLSADPEMSSKGRRTQAQGAVAARAAAAEARLAREKAEKEEKKPKLELDIDWDEEEGGGVGGWETEDEDKPEVKLEQEEKDWLREDMREWRQRAEGGPSPDRKARGVKRGAEASLSPAPQPRAGPSSSRACASSSASSFAANGKKRASPSSPSAAASSALADLTPEERAWIASDLASSSFSSSSSAGKVKKEESDDEVEIIEPAGGGGKKKMRVCYMPMPVEMGGEGGQKGKGKGKQKAPTPPPSDLDSDALPDPSAVLARSLTHRASPKKAARASSSSAGEGKKKKEKQRAVHFSDFEDDEDEKPGSPSSSPKHKRGPMKYFSTGNDAVDFAKKPKPVVKKRSSSPSAGAAKKKRSTVKEKHRAIRPPSDSEVEAEDAGELEAGAAKGKAKAKDGKKKKKKEPATWQARQKAALAKKHRESDKELIAEIERDEAEEQRAIRRARGMPSGSEGEEEKEGPARKKAKRAVQAPGGGGAGTGKEQKKKAIRPPEDEDGAPAVAGGGKTKKASAPAKGKGKAIRPPSSSSSDDDPRPLARAKGKNKVEVVGLEVRAVFTTASEPIKPFSPPRVASSSKAKAQSKPSPLRPAAAVANLKEEKPSASLPSAFASLPASPSRSKPTPRRQVSKYTDSFNSDCSVASSASSVCAPPPSSGDVLSLSSDEADEVLFTLARQKAFNDRLAVKRRAKAEREKKEEEARRRIERSVGEAQRDAAARGLTPGVTVESPSGKAAGWGKNVFSEDAGPAATSDPRKQLEQLLGVRLGSPTPAAAGPSGQAGRAPVKGKQKKRTAVPFGKSGKVWRCRECEFDNDAAAPVCELCDLGNRNAPLGWFDES
ncbi:hypothetical protein JCM10213v2_002178 [Rhodosporidiobolus nylandii]